MGINYDKSPLNEQTIQQKTSKSKLRACGRSLAGRHVGDGQQRPLEDRLIFTAAEIDAVVRRSAGDDEPVVTAGIINPVLDYRQGVSIQYDFVGTIFIRGQLAQ